MPILFGSLWESAEHFSIELQRLGFDPLQGELRKWWIIFRNVQNDLQINAQTVIKARYLCVQEWEILSTTYLNAKIYFEKSVNDLVKQTAKNTASAYVAAQEEKTQNVKEFLTDKNTNEREIDQNLIHFISHLDIHFHNLARISPMGKLLREYRDRIALAIPYNSLVTDIQPPTYGIEPIYTTAQGGIELRYDENVLDLNEDGQLTVINTEGNTYNFIHPLSRSNVRDIRLLYNSNDFNLNQYNQLSVIDKSIINEVSTPLIIANKNLSLNYNPNDFNLNSNHQLSLVDEHKANIDAVSAPLEIINKELILRSAPPFYINSESQLALKIGSHLGLNADGSLDGLPYLAIEPLRLTNNTEFSLGYDSPLYENSNQNLGIRIDGTTITLNEENELQATGIQEPAHPLYINESNDLALAFGSPLFMNSSNQLTLNYTPVFKLNEQQQLDLSIAKPLILDSNHDLTIDYSGGLWLSNNQLKINLATENSLTINNRNELVLNYNSSLYTNPNNNQLGVWFEGTFNNESGVKFCRLTESEIDGPMGISVDTASGLEVNTNKGDYERIALSSTVKTQISTLENKLSQLKQTNQIITQLNNRITLLTDVSKCSDEILHQEHYRFQNKIQRYSFRNDNLVEIPANKRIVNVKGTFFIQHNYAGYKFATFTLNKFQKYSFATHPNNVYYATYIGYFSTTMANPIYLRIYQEGNWLKYYLYSENVSPNQGYNIECDYQVITCDGKDFLRSTWNLISGNIYLNNENWLYKLPNALKLVPTETINLSWTYKGQHIETSNFAVQFGTWVRLYLNNHDGPVWQIKLNNSDTFNLELVSGLDHALIQNLKLTKH